MSKFWNNIHKLALQFTDCVFDAGNSAAYTLVINTGFKFATNHLCVNDILTNRLHYRGPVWEADNETLIDEFPAFILAKEALLPY
jgi:hypothetical protein